MNFQEIDRFIKETKLWLQQNLPPREDHQEYWVDHDGNLQKVPKGMYFDAEGDCPKFKKGR